MLTAKEIAELPKGTHSNSTLRKKGAKQGTPIQQRKQIGEDQFYDYTTTGNRSQRRQRIANPLPKLKTKPLSPVTPAPVVQEVTKPVTKWQKVLDFISRLWKKR